MSTKKYRYSGPHSAVTLKVADASGALVDREVMLWSGSTVELPPDHEFVAVLVQRGLLEPVNGEQARAADKTMAANAVNAVSAANGAGTGRASKPSAEQAA